MYWWHLDGTDQSYWSEERKTHASLESALHLFAAEDNYGFLLQWSRLTICCQPKTWKSHNETSLNLALIRNKAPAKSRCLWSHEWGPPGVTSFSAQHFLVIYVIPTLWQMWTKFSELGQKWCDTDGGLMHIWSMVTFVSMAEKVSASSQNMLLHINQIKTCWVSVKFYWPWRWKPYYQSILGFLRTMCMTEKEK